MRKQSYVKVDRVFLFTFFFVFHFFFLIPFHSDDRKRNFRSNPITFRFHFPFDSFLLFLITFYLTDINECFLDPESCDDGYKCINTIGSFECIPHPVNKNSKKYAKKDILFQV
jgi:hypothetical protein